MSRQTRPPTENEATVSAKSIRQGRDRVWEHRFVWLLLLVIVGLWAYTFLISRVDNKLTTEILKRIRQEFPTHLVFIDRAHLQAGQSITIEGIRIAKPTDQGVRDVIRCGRLVCTGPIELIGLVQGQFPVQKAVADGVEICVWPLSDGRFSIEELRSSKPLHPNFPAVEVRSGLIRVGSETGRSEQEIICHDLRANAQLAPRLVDGHVMPLTAKIAASVSSSYFTQATLIASVSEDKQSWIAQGKIDKLDYSPRLVSQLPLALQPYLSHVAGLSGEINSAFAARCEHGRITYEARANIAKGRLLHPKVPYPLESLSGEVHCKDGVVQFKNVRAASGQTSIALACNLHGLSMTSPLAANIVVQNLSLDDRLYRAVPQALQETWHRLGVSGVVDAKASLRFDGKQWIPHVLVRAKNAGLEPEFFPYPIKNIQGDFVYERGSIVASSLIGTAGEQTLRGALTLTQAQPRWLMDLKLAADSPIPIDETLLKSLSPRNSPQSNMHKFIMSLHPTGTVFLKQGHFARTADQPDNIAKTLELTFSECSIRYDTFAYPIDDVNGQVTIDNDRLILKDFTGRNDSARINGHGVCQCTGSNLGSIELFFDAYDVGLDEELQQALPRSVRGLWDQLQPSGVLDKVAVEIRKINVAPPDIRVAITEDRESESHAGRAVSIRPVSLPYQVNDVACSIIYRPGQVDIVSLEGQHDASILKTEGTCRLHSDGTWDGLLTWLPSTRLKVDQSLLNCLPSYLREPLARMDFQGPVSITGTTRVSSPPTPAESIVRQWDVELQIEDGRLGGGGIASGIRGSISLAGENTTKGPMAFGNLMLDALAVKNIAVTRVHGPFAFNKQELLFGRDATAWQTKNNIRAPSLNSNQTDNSVSTAIYLSPRNSNNNFENSVAPASFRSTIRDSLSGKGPLLSRNTPPPVDPNLIRPPQDVPDLDVKETDIVAHTLSGTMFVSGIEPLDGQQRSKYRLRLVDADLQGFLVDLGETNTQATGRLSVQCDLQGLLTNTSSLEGQGRGWLRQANLYELPAMIRLFQAIKLTPGKGAFNSADVQFGIDGDRIPVHELVLDGDLVSMRGSGWVNMRREIHLDLFAHVGRGNIVGTIFHPITRSNAARLWQIEVSGSTTDPQIRVPRPLMNTFEKVRPEENDYASR